MFQDKNNNGDVGGKHSSSSVAAPVVAVSIKGARVSYGKGANRTNVLDDLTMTVHKGAM